MFRSVLRSGRIDGCTGRPINRLAVRGRGLYATISSSDTSAALLPLVVVVLSVVGEEYQGMLFVLVNERDMSHVDSFNSLHI